MKTKIPLFIICLTLSLNTFSQVSFKIGSVLNAEPGTYINIPFIISGVSATGAEFVGLQFRITAQESVITFDSLANAHPLAPLNQWVAGSPPGYIAANWLEATITPIHVDDNSVLVELVCFYNGGQTNLDFDVAYSEIIDGSFNPIEISEMINGTITQSQGSDNSVWNGTGQWSDAGSWSNGIPGDSTNAIINSGSTEIVNAAVCKNLTINTESALVIQAGKSLTVNGDYINDGSIVIESDSLVQGSLIIRGTATQNGTSEMMHNVYNGIYYFISSPVQSATGQVLTDHGNTSLYLEADNNWSQIQPSTVLEPGKGYSLEANAETQLVFSGPYNTTSLGSTLSYTAHGNLAQDGWNLIGNPYTSSFNTDLYLTTTNADRAIYTWDGNRYRVWNGISGSIPGGIIPPVTSFFIKAGSANATATFHPDGKIHDFSHFTNSVSLPEDVLKIEISKLENPTFADEAFLQIQQSSTPGFDAAIDAHKLSNNNGHAEIFFRDADGMDCAIASIPDAYESNAGVRIPANDAYVIHAEKTNLPSDLPIYIIDRELVLTKDLRAEDYIFLSDAGYYPDRFLIVLTELGIEDQPGNTWLNIYGSNGQINLLPQENLGQASIQVYDLSGRLIGSTQMMLEKGKLVILRGIPGLNLVKVTGPDFIFTRKVFLN
jgi:hypothetical protein